MTDVRCSCSSGKVLQKVLPVNDKNMDGARLMNHSILCAEKFGGKIMHRSGKKLAEKNGIGVKTMHQKMTPALGSRGIYWNFNLKVLSPHWSIEW